MCLTGVDYFSTLGYQPGIAALAAGALSPIATLVLVLVTLFGALPMYRRVAEESPHGDGSLSMLERLLSYWPSKLFVLSLIGFVATGFVITITLSAADATAHLVENPFLTDALHGHEVSLTLVLLGLLGAVFLKGFSEAIGVAVVLVVVYLGLNVVVVGDGLWQVVRAPRHRSPTGPTPITDDHAHPAGDDRRGAAGVPAPRARPLRLRDRRRGDAAGQGRPDRHRERPTGRIRNTKKLLTGAALIMSVLLIGSRPRHDAADPGRGVRGGRRGERPCAGLPGPRAARRRASGPSTTSARSGSSGSPAPRRMAGLLNIVPRYLPRYGMAPDWARATRPLVLIFTLIASS